MSIVVCFLVPYNCFTFILYECLLYFVQFIYLVLNCLFIVYECLIYFVLFTITRIAYKSCLIVYYQ